MCAPERHPWHVGCCMPPCKASTGGWAAVHCLAGNYTLGPLNQQDSWRHASASHLLRVGEGQCSKCGPCGIHGCPIMGLGPLLCLSSSLLICCTPQLLRACFCPRLLH